MNETTFETQLRSILSDSRTYQKKLDLLLRSRHYFDWKTLYPFDTYMYMFQSELYPETRHPTDFLGLDSLVELTAPQ